MLVSLQSSREFSMMAVSSAQAPIRQTDGQYVPRHKHHLSGGLLRVEGGAMTNRVCLVSRNEISREGLAHFLRSEQFDVFCSVATIEDIPDSSTAPPFLAVIDEPKAARQQAVVESLKTLFANAKVVILANRFDLDAMVSCFRTGAEGYIVNAMKSQPLMTALRLVSLGEKVMPSDLVEALEHRQFSGPSPVLLQNEIVNANLSPRERDVLCGLMAGYPNKSIARQLDVCEATVKVHVKAILRKLKVRNRTQAAIWASHNGIAESPTVQASGDVPHPHWSADNSVSHLRALERNEILQFAKQ
jgi:two-component system nitrate/nitrite response regulator NarL